MFECSQTRAGKNQCNPEFIMRKKIQKALEGRIVSIVGAYFTDAPASKVLRPFPAPHYEFTCASLGTFFFHWQNVDLLDRISHIPTYALELEQD